MTSMSPLCTPWAKSILLDPCTAAKDGFTMYQSVPEGPTPVLQLTEEVLISEHHNRKEKLGKLILRLRAFMCG